MFWFGGVNGSFAHIVVVSGINAQSQVSYGDPASGVVHRATLDQFNAWKQQTVGLPNPLYFARRWSATREGPMARAASVPGGYVQYRRHIIVLTATIAVVVALTLLTWRLAGPQSVSISILGATLVSRLIDDRLSGRRLAWGGEQSRRACSWRRCMGDTVGADG